MTLESKSQILLKRDYNHIIDREFKELILNIPNTESSIVSIDDFFNIFDEIFYSIDKEGETHSHRYLYTRISDYLGENTSEYNLQDLLDEINTLNRELLDTTKELEFIKNAIQ